MTQFESGLNDLLVDTFHRIIKFEERSLRALPCGPVTSHEAHLIEAVGAGDDTVSSLSRRFQVAMPTVTIAVKRLVRKGYVNKTPEATGNRIRISLTESGEMIERAHRLFHRKMIRRISGGLSEQERSVLLEAVEKLRAFFEEQR